MGRIRILFVCLGIAIGAPVCASEFGFGSIRELIASHGIRSVEELIEALPPDLRTHYTLVFASRSLQGANFANPRAILFGSDAGLIVTFNGDPAERGYAAVETMEFDSRTNTFFFREIRFAEDGSDPVSVSEANPSRCMACHGQPARPIWDTPPTWPGVYGERYRAGLSTQESVGMREFLARQSNHPRYRNLLRPAVFSERDTYMPSARGVYNGVVTEPPNAQLSVLLATQNTRSIISEILSRPAYQAHRYALLAATEENCGALADFYPESVRAAVLTELHMFTKLSADIDRLQATAKSARLTAPGGGTHGAVKVAEFNKLRFVVEYGLELSTHHWTLALERNTHDLAAPEGALTLEKALINAVLPTDKPLRDLHALRAVSSNDKYCELLRHESVSTLEAWYRKDPRSVTRWIGEPVAAATSPHP